MSLKNKIILKIFMVLHKYCVKRSNRQLRIKYTDVFTSSVKCQTLKNYDKNSNCI